MRKEKLENLSQFSRSFVELQILQIWMVRFKSIEPLSLWRVLLKILLHFWKIGIYMNKLENLRKFAKSQIEIFCRALKMGSHCSRVFKRRVVKCFWNASYKFESCTATETHTKKTSYKKKNLPHNGNPPRKKPLTISSICVSVNTSCSGCADMLSRGSALFCLIYSLCGKYSSLRALLHYLIVEQFRLLIKWFYPTKSPRTKATRTKAPPTISPRYKSPKNN